MEPESKKENMGHEASDKQEAFAHLAQGKRHLLVKDYQEAVTSLALSCELLSRLYGEVANECGEAYYNYGKALLELARTENGVLGMEGEGEESQDSDEDEGEDEKEEKESDGKNVENGKDDESQENEKDDDNTNSESRNEDNDNTNGESKNEDETKDNDKGDDTETKDDSGEEDDVSNLRLAWEMLELAKVIFKRQAEGNKQMNLKLAEVHLKLGEVGLESENYIQAIDDIKTCLDIQTLNLDEHDRCIAETHYQLGMAFSLNNDFDEAIVQLNHAHNLLEKRIDFLKEQEKQGATNEQSESNPFYTIKDEIAEISSLLPEVKEKISDMEDFKKETKKALIAGLDVKKDCSNSEAGQGSSSGSSGAFPLSSSSESSGAFPLSSSSESSGAFPLSSVMGSEAKPISDISHLVRKKRKLEPDSSEEKNSKQPCPEVSKVE